MHRSSGSGEGPAGYKGRWQLPRWPGPRQEKYGVIALLEQAEGQMGYRKKIVSVHLFDRERMEPARELPAGYEDLVDFWGDPVAALTRLCTECRPLLQQETHAGN